MFRRWNPRETSGRQEAGVPTTTSRFLPNAIAHPIYRKQFLALTDKRGKRNTTGNNIFSPMCSREPQMFRNLKTQLTVVPVDKNTSTKAVQCQGQDARENTGALLRRNPKACKIGSPNDAVLPEQFKPNDIFALQTK